MIDQLSKKIAALLAKRLSTDRDTEEVYQYGLNLLLGSLVEVLLILFIAYFLHTFYTTLVVLLVFALFRAFAGGAHMSTQGRCLLVGTLQIVILGALATIPISKVLLNILILCVLLFNLGVIIKWVPGGTTKKPLDDPALRKRSKLITLGMALVWLTITAGMIFSDNTRYVLAMIMGAFSAMFLVTPLGYRFNAVLDIKPN